MSIRLVAEVGTTASPARVWSVLVDWAGQERWVPLTTVRVEGRQTGVGTRAEALSGRRVRGVPVGLLDRFVVTGWRPPNGSGPGELEVLHLGPQFRGEGVFRIESAGEGSQIRCTELFAVPFGALGDLAGRLALPILRRGLRHSLGALAGTAESPDRPAETQTIRNVQSPGRSPVDSTGEDS